MDTPAQDYLAARSEMRALLGEDDWAELQSIAAALDAGLLDLKRGSLFGPDVDTAVALTLSSAVALLRVLVLGQLDHEIRMRELAWQEIK